MRILSLYFGHDANLTLLEDGEALAVLEKERLTRVKHDQGAMDLDAILAGYGWMPETIDIVVINPYTRPTMEGQDFQWVLEGESYDKRPDYKEDGWSGPPEGRMSRHRIRLFDRWYEGYAVDHHLAHVAGALFTSPFDEAGILSADGSGDLRACALAWGSGHRIHEIEYGWGYEKKTMQLNIGALWASIGEYNFGMKRLEGAGKLMGLASYGSPREEIMEALREQMLYFPFAPLQTYRFGRGDELRLDPQDRFAQDVCASLQQVTTDIYLEAAARMKSWKNAERLVLTGGCSMNCIANTAVHQSGLFAATWVPAQPHDGGLSLGQALFVWHHLLGQPRRPKAWSPYLGTDAGRIGLDVIPQIIAALEQGRSVGICHGKAESGPRALGHRSILLDPRIPDGKERLNREVKNREWYRPYAPMAFGDWSVPSKYMSYIIPTEAAEVPAVTHVDGTTRPQIVDDGDDPFVVALLRAWRQKTGCSLLLNTSFNCQEPLVNTVDEAYATWKRTGLDVLVTPRGIATDKAKG
jgi:carbamoyltransferase